MNPRLLDYYNQELLHIRESAAEFASEYPKIASRLSLSGIDCADPYVERLLEGFAYLTARVQLKLDAEYPTFTHNLLEIAYPHYLAPTPSMVMVQLQADPNRATLFATVLAELQSKPTIVVIEDIHWADVATLDLLKFLGRRLQRDGGFHRVV